MLLLAACTKQPHHAAPPAELQQAMARALDVCLAERGLQRNALAPTERRDLDLRSAVLVAHAQDDARATAAILAGQLGETQLRQQADQVLLALSRRDGAHIEPILPQVLRRQTLDQDALLLLRAMLRSHLIKHRLPEPSTWESWP